MYAVIYKFKLKLDTEELYKSCWEKITNYMREHRGSLGSSLHQVENSDDNVWIAYARWPDRETYEAAVLPILEDSGAPDLVQEIKEAITKGQECIASTIEIIKMTVELDKLASVQSQAASVTNNNCDEDSALTPGMTP